MEGALHQPIKNQVFSYYGSKWVFSRKIIDIIPRHKTYVEPFCGSASVLFKKPPSRIEVINDHDFRIFNFFQTLKYKKEELLQRLQYSIYSRNEFSWARDYCRSKNPNDVELAYAFFVLAN